MKTGQTFGFTLIELLIVVAIIAVLAAIAVPNFLDAHVRSQVSRTMADMKAESGAIQMYILDNRYYPAFTKDEWYADYLMVNGGKTRYAGTLLTTPISYITAIPMDSFNSKMATRSSFYAGGKQFAVIVSWCRHNASQQIRRMLDDSIATPFFHRGWGYYMESCGPDLTWWRGFGATADFADRIMYDPTNGTISQGQISLTDKGWVSPRNK